INVDLSGHGEKYSAVLYDSTNGLPTSEANALAQTSDGFMWIGSYSGLIRYDGNTFERIDSTTGIASVVRLFVDSKDRLWVGTNDGGAAVMERNEFRMFTRHDGLPSSTVRSITEDFSGNIYIATTRGVVMIDEEMELHAVQESQILNEYVRELRAARDGLVYGITQTGSVFILQNGKMTAFYDRSKLGIPDIMCILPDIYHNGYLYFGTEDQEVYYGRLDDIGNAEAIPTSPLTYIKSMIQVKDMLWVCADNGAGFLQDGEIHVLENLPMNNSIDRMMTDYEGNIWFASSRQGVMKIVPNRFTDITERYSLEPAVVNSTCELNGLLFLGTDTGLQVLGEEAAVSNIPLEAAVSASGSPVGSSDLMDLLKTCRIRSIIRDSKDRLWFSTYSQYGLVRYDDGKVTCFTSQDGMPSDRVRTITERADGTIVAACSGGVAVIQDDVVIDILNEDNGMTNTEILTVCEADNGDLILGSDGDGIYILSDNKVTHLGLDEGLSSDVIMRIKADRTRNIYWIVSSNSIGSMNANYEVSIVSSFPYSNNFDLYENSTDEMWILSSNGVYVEDVNDLLRNRNISPTYFSMDNGLPCFATANSYSWLAENGNLYIAGGSGVSMVNIDEPFDNVDRLKMAVPYVEGDGVKYYPDSTGTITVPSEVKKLTIPGYVFNYSLTNPLVTFYLEGFDTKQTTVRRSELTPLDYTNLKGGDYRFVMELRDSTGRGTNILRIPIIKEKALYEQTWFRILCGVMGLLVIGLIVYFYVRRKTAALMKKEKENRIFIREMTQAFAKTIDMKDNYTNGHSTRVADYTAMLTRELGYDEETVEKYYNIALLHDIGKIGVPVEVLNKPGKLTDEEFNIIKSHSSLGYSVLKDISIMPELAVGAGAHHERPDGRGYPRGLKGDEIPRVAQIIAV
ncbi:MAG: HD domain-containing protein, partial [Solobacterium sp.]|nr:HD domain-containing protein [Solobacterium sp.]